MASKTIMLLAASLVLPAVLGKNAKKECKAIVHDSYNLNGHKKEFRKGDHSNLGSWNDRIEAIQAVGGSGCYVKFCEHSNFQGRCLGPLKDGYGLRFPRGSEIHRKISSIKVGESRRRTAADDVGLIFFTAADDLELLEDEFEVFEVDDSDLEDRYDPLCDAVYHELLETHGQMFANHTIKQWSMENIVNKCETAFDDPVDVFQCQFYAYTAVEIFDDERIFNTLRIDDSTVTDKLEEYEHCGLLNVEINKFVKSGRLSGVTIEKHDDGDYFRLEEPLTADSVDLVPNTGGKFQAVVSAGALLAMWIGSTLVKVCRDFDVQTGAWLLA